MAYFNPRLHPPTVKLRVIAIQRTPEKLADLNGLTMDKCDMDSKTYSYRDSQFLHGDLAYKRIRCPDCYGTSLGVDVNI